jgi:hypothetical protein
MRRFVPLLFLAAACALAQEKYNGPRPPKTDLPYLVHGSTLIPTEAVEANQEEKKDESVYVISGASSSARTPLAEPIFLIESDKLNPERIELWRVESRGGRREVALPKKAKRNAPRPLRVNVTRLGGRLFRIEAAQVLENGEYSLSPADSNQAFCFSVY